MRVPIEWLKQYVDFHDTPKGLAERLTFCGIEVEGIETIGSDYTGVVVGEVRAVERHPNADRLTVCRVFDGTAERQVVCGAPGVQAGGRHPFAPVGVTLPNGLKLKPAKLRGVESQGMLCAEDELGVSDDHSGLMKLPADAVPGTPLSAILGGPETVLDLEITPNRPDCLCILGVAREVAALYGTRMKPPADTLAEAGEPVTAAARVEVIDASLCPRYTARIVRGVRIGPSPRWMQRRLELAGIRPINNAVDVTNYVMLECGQPLHAFDLALLRGARIVVRPAAADEAMHTLDGQERRLAASMLVIADAGGPVAVAGVMGGAGSEIRDTTTDILLESACFKPSSVRATSKALGLTTESSYRFARGVDADGADRASRRAAALLAELAGGCVAPGVIDAYPQPAAPVSIACRTSFVRRVTGIETDTATVAAVLESLELTTQRVDDDTLQVGIPPFRGDLRREVDLVEEFARIHGLDRIPARTPSARVVDGADDLPIRSVAAVRAALVGLGLHEIMNYSLTSDTLLDRFGLDDPARRIRLPNPLSAEQGVLRSSLIPQMMETLGRNRARQVGEAACFEFGRVFSLDAEGRTVEAARVAIGLLGPAGRGGLAKRAEVSPGEAFGWLKGIVGQALAALRAPAPTLTPAEGAAAFEPGQAFRVAIAGADAGIAGIARRKLAAEDRIFEPVAVAELDLAALAGHAFDVPSPRPPPPYPSSSRDVAFVVARAVRHEDVLASVKRAAPRELEKVELFDVYEGKGIGEGRRSMAYSLTYRSADRTLTDEEVQRFHDRIVEALAKDLGAEVRAS